MFLVSKLLSYDVVNRWLLFGIATSTFQETDRMCDNNIDQNFNTLWFALNCP